MGKLTDAFIDVARGYVGTQEQPKGSNCGPEVNRFLRNVGLDRGYAWCAAFEDTCGDEAMRRFGLDWPLPSTADCDVLFGWAKKRGLLRLAPQRGDVFLRMAGANDADHTGIVVAVNGDGTVETVEGNSNLDGSREGYAVVNNKARRIHAAGRLPLQFIRWIDVLDDSFHAWRVQLMGAAAPLPTEGLMLNGFVYAPAREVLTAVYGETRTQANLAVAASDNGLTWAGRLVNAPLVKKGGAAWVAVRPLCESLQLSLNVDPVRKLIFIKAVD